MHDLLYFEKFQTNWAVLMYIATLPWLVCLSVCLSSEDVFVLCYLSMAQYRGCHLIVTIVAILQIQKQYL